MTLSAFLPTIANNNSLNVKLIDTADEVLIVFNASGYGSIESDLGAREIILITVLSSTEIIVKIANA